MLLSATLQAGGVLPAARLRLVLTDSAEFATVCAMFDHRWQMQPPHVRILSLLRGRRVVMHFAVPYCIRC